MKKILSFLLVLCMVLGLMPVTASAATEWAYVRWANGTETRYSTFPDAWNAATSSGDKNTVGLLNNWDGGHFVVSAGKTVTVEMNGYVITRDLSSSKDDGEVFWVGEKSTLIVYGGNKENPTYGSKNSDHPMSHSVNVYVANGDRYDYTRRKETLYGGIINGGNSDDGGGGIHMKESAKVYLYGVTIAGNKADSYGAQYGDGGGIKMNNKYGYLYMEDSQIIYNCAHDDGGGLFINAAYCQAEMVRSRIDHNVADDNGAGIYVEGNNFTLKGDARQIMDPDAAISQYGINDWTGAYNYFPPVNEIGSSVSYNCVFDAEDGGGGIYCDNETALIAGINIFGNIATNNDDKGDGGGIYLDEEEITIRNCNIFRNKSDCKGGGIHNRGDDNILDRDDNTIDSCTIYKNLAWETGGAGGGIYLYRYCDLNVAGTLIVRGNVSNGLENDNLFLSSDGAEINAYLMPSTSPGADIHVRLSTSGASGHSRQITRDPGSYDDTHFSYDNDVNKHIGWDRSWDDRHLRVYDGKKASRTEPTVFVPDEGKRVQVLANKYNGYELIKGIVSYPSFPDEDADIENVFYYSDGFFANDTHTYNPQLGTLSMCLAGAAGYSNEYGKDDSEGDYLDKSQNFRQFVSDIGCKDEDIYVNDFNTQKPGSDTIGVGIASKDMVIGGVDKKLVIIGVRGMGYEKEWISNLTLGAEGEAAGWSSAATQVMAELKEYLSRKGIDGSSENTIFWIAGYSRAGATSNLTAKRIVDTYDNQGTHTFAYPLEAPKGGVSSEIVAGNNYNCIHNIINNNDIVPWAGTTEMGLIRYGVDHYVPGSTEISANPTDHNDANRVPVKNNIPEDNEPWDVEDTLHHGYKDQAGKMLAHLKAVNQDILFDDYYHQATIKYVEGGVIGTKNMIEETSDHENEVGTTEHFIEFFFTKLQEYAFKFGTDGKTVSSPYANNPRAFFATYSLNNSMTFQQAAGAAAGVVFGMPADRKDGLIDSMNGLMGRLDDKSDLFFDLDEDGIEEGDLLKDLKGIWKQLTDPNTEQIAKGARSIKDFLTTDEFKVLDDGYVSLLFPILCFVGMDYDKYGQDVVGSAAYNIPRIIANHYPEVTHAWLRSYDYLYANDTTPVVMDPSAKTAPSPAKLVISHADGSEDTEVVLDSAKTGENAITIRIDDVVKMIPSNTADIDVGEAIYYQFTDGPLYYNRSTHSYSEPLVLEDIERDYSVNGVFSLQVTTAHNGTKLDWVPVQLVPDGNAVLSAPFAYANGEIQYAEWNVEKEKEQVIETLVGISEVGWRDLEELGYAFMGWKVYQYIPTGEPYTPGTVGEEISPVKYAEYFGTGFNPDSKKTTVTNLKGINARFVPVLEPAVDVSLIFETIVNGMPTTARWTTADGTPSEDYAILWNYDAENDTYVATVSFVVDSDVNHFRVDSISFDNPEAGYQISLPENATQVMTMSVTDTSNVVTVIVTCTPKSADAAESLNADSEEAADTAEGQNADSVEAADTVESLNTETKEAADSDGSLDIENTEAADSDGIPDAENTEAANAAGSLIDNDNYGYVYTYDNNQNEEIQAYRVAIVKGYGIIGLYGDLVAPGFEGMEFNHWTKGGYNEQSVTVSGYSDGGLKAYYHPVVSAAEVVLDKPLKAGETMPSMTQTVVTISNHWRIDSADFKWDSTDAEAGYNKQYSAKLTVDLDNLTGTNLDDPGSGSVSLTGVFDFADELEITVKDAEGNPINAGSSMDLDVRKIILNLTFDKTAKPSVITGFEDISIIVPHGSSTEYILGQLPTEVNASLEDGRMVTVPVEWTDVDAYVSSEDAQVVTARGYCVVEEYTLADGVSLTADVLVEEAERTSMPTAMPGTGKYTGLQVVNLTADEGATIYYATKTFPTENYYIITTDPDTGEEISRKVNPQIALSEPEGSEYQTYAEPITLNQYGNVTVVYAYATKEGLRSSGVITYSYDLAKPEVKKLDAKDPKIAENGNIECWYSTKMERTGFDEEGKGIYEEVPDKYYADEGCTTLLDYEDDVLIPAFIRTTHTALDEDIVATFIRKYEDETVIYDGLETLGVQAIGTDGKAARVLAVLDARIIEAATDYGYLFDTDETKLDVDSAQYKFTCKGTTNTLYSGTDYCFVTAKIANDFLTPDMKACFYVKLENGTDYICSNAVSCEATINGSEATDGATDNITAGQEEEVPRFVSHQLILSGQIGMHFYMNIPEGMADGTMTFSVGDRTETASGTLQTDGRYKFTCYITSVEMAEEITAVYTYTADGETKTVTDATSVKAYLEVLIVNKNGIAAYKAATPLAKAIYNYGHYAMKAVPGGSKHPMMPDTYTGDVTLITTLDGYAISAKLDKNVITKASYSLNLDSETAINFYLTTDIVLTKDNVSVEASEATFNYTVEKVGARYRVQITGIGAHELGTVFTMKTGNTEIAASALTYVQQRLANSNASQESKDAAAALYEYYQEVIKYRS